MSTQQSASARITAEVTAWPGVEAGTGERGEYGFRVGSDQIGHLHGDRVAHFGFPRELGAKLRDEGRVEPHPVNRHSTKMAARRIDSDGDIGEVIALMRLNYERVLASADQRSRPAPESGVDAPAASNSPASQPKAKV